MMMETIDEVASVNDDHVSKLEGRKSNLSGHLSNLDGRVSKSDGQISKLDGLSAETVFHDIDIKLEDEIDEEFEGETVLPDPDWETEGYKPLVVDSDDEWDTDLEDDGNSNRRYLLDNQTEQVYIAACRQLKIVPAHCFLKAINTDTINLNFQGLGPVGTRAVATAMVKDMSARRLLMAGNFIGSNGIRYICDMLKENEFLHHVDLSENGLGTYAAQLISDVFKDNDTIVSLSLAGNEFKDRDAEHFAAILSVGQYTGLRKLDLSHNHFGDAGAKILGKAIDHNETLVELNLSWNQIRREGIHEIAKGLGDNNSLKKIDLSANGIDDAAADCLGRALASNRYLTEINLNSNRIGIEGIKALFTYIGKNESLKIIRLTNNPISLEGPLVAITLLKHSDVCVLEELEIADACVPRQFYAVLEEVQKTRPEFKVRLGGYMNARDMCKAVAKTTSENWQKDPTLVFINFIEERKIKIFDLFKQFDKDRSCTLTRDEMVTGLSKIGCPLDNSQLIQLLHTLDVDKNGEIDLVEFMDGYTVHKRRFSKYQKGGSRASSARSRPPSQSSSRPTSRLGSGVNRTDAIPFLDVPNDTSSYVTTEQPTIDSDVILAVPKSYTVT